MKPQTCLNKKWAPVYGIAIITLAISIYYLTLPFETKLRLFCTTDYARIAKDSPTRTNGYWTNPNTGTNLTVITIWEVIDGGSWLYYDNDQNIFWITVQHGPMKNTTYGPYQGNLWTLTNTVNPLALAGITLSAIALIYRPLSKLWTRKSTQPQPQAFKEVIITVSKRALVTSGTRSQAYHAKPVAMLDDVVILEHTDDDVHTASAA
jgi:hypothetical protein